MTTTMTTHGTNNHYAAGCRCAPCTEAHRVYAANYRAHTIPPGRIDAGPARAHVRALLELGMTGKAIAEASGVSPQAITYLRGGRGSARCLRLTSEAILAVPLQPGVAHEPVKRPKAARFKVAPKEPDAQTITDRANLDAFLARVHRGRRAA